MGYMGFGMRKEVYQRKPKKAFEKIKKLYEQEIKKNESDKLNVKNRKLDENLKQRIRDRIKKDDWSNFIKRVMISSLLCFLLVILIKIAIKTYEEVRPKPKITVEWKFNRKRYLKDGEINEILDYYRFGGLAERIRMEKGMKHQLSESYYLTGEQFRSALYKYDTLVYEYYFYKNGDTIHNYPKVDPLTISQVSLKLIDKTITFNVLDHKVIKDSYVETMH